MSLETNAGSIDSQTTNKAGKRIVISPHDFQQGAPMEVGRKGVRDKKLIYPETGFEASTLCLGVVEIDPGHHSPLHRHNCEELYYVIEGAGEVEQDGEFFPIGKGDAVLNPTNIAHRVHNTGDVPIRMAVVGGIMFVPLLPEWPTASPYEILEEADED